MNDNTDEKKILRKPSYDRVTVAVSITVIIMVLCAVIINLYFDKYGNKKNYYESGNNYGSIKMYEYPNVWNGLTVIGENIKILEFSNSVEQGEYATVRIQGEPYKNYSITVNLKSGPSQSKALTEKNANKHGVVEWRWKIANNTTPCEAQVIITRTDDKNEYITYAQMTLIITEKNSDI